MRKGFTLIEALVVIAIIAVFAAILIPSVIDYNKKAKQAEIRFVNTFALNIKDLDRFPHLVSVVEVMDYNRSVTFTSRLTNTSTGLVKLQFDEPSYLYIKDHMYIVDVKSILGLWKSEQANKANQVEAEK